MLEKLENIKTRHTKSATKTPYKISICTASGCPGASEVKAALESGVKERGLKDQYVVKEVGCRGLCACGPLVGVGPSDQIELEAETHYQKVKVDAVPSLLDDISGDGSDQVEKLPVDIPFFQRQHKIVLENSGIIDPTSIEEYIAHDGYQALVTAVTEMTPRQVIGEITRSGLRGRGGGGYPTGLKWTTVAKQRMGKKYVICNGDEGDPGAFMDRSVMEGDPHKVLEGMAIAAYAIGADEGYIYVRGEYPLAIARLKRAISQAKRQNFLGERLFDTEFNFQVHIRIGAGAFVCGEETALIASIEGKRGLPRPRPPYPAEVGLWGQPTLINNVETFANVAPIIRMGGEAYASIGTEGSKGTKVFALTGSLANTGLIEVPMGTTLQEIIFEIGGGITDGKRVKAVQTGGPSGGCIPAEKLNTPVDYESLRELGSMMGSGGMIVMDETTSMVDVSHYFMDFSRAESCGKCIPCRAGTAQMVQLLAKFKKGTATQADLVLLRQLCDVVKHTSLCGLGQAAPNPVLSALRFFEEEFETA